MSPTQDVKMKRLLLLTTAAIFSASMAYSAITANDVVALFQADGYTNIEVKTGLTQIKVEAIKDGMKVEAIYDIESGLKLKEEVEAAGDEADDSGVEISVEDHDFLDDSDEGDDSNDDEGDDSNDDEGDDSDDEGDDSGDDEGDDN
jgi:hypothetical protein